MRYGPGGQTFVFFFSSSGGWGLRFFFSHTCKNRCNFLICSLITLKFGISKEHTKVNSGTEFGTYEFDKYSMCKEH